MMKKMVGGDMSKLREMGAVGEEGGRLTLMIRGNIMVTKMTATRGKPRNWRNRKKVGRMIMETADCPRMVMTVITVIRMKTKANIQVTKTCRIRQLNIVR